MLQTITKMYLSSKSIIIMEMKYTCNNRTYSLNSVKKLANISVKLSQKTQQYTVKPHHKLKLNKCN